MLFNLQLVTIYSLCSASSFLNGVFLMLFMETFLLPSAANKVLVSVE